MFVLFIYLFCLLLCITNMFCQLLVAGLRQLGRGTIPYTTHRKYYKNIALMTTKDAIGHEQLYLTIATAITFSLARLNSKHHTPKVALQTSPTPPTATHCSLGLSCSGWHESWYHGSTSPRTFMSRMV